MKAKTEAELQVMYDYVSQFYDGIAQVRKGEEWFHIWPDGTPTYEQRYWYVSPFAKGFAWAWENSTKKFQIRSDGSRVS
ncbi:MAG: hypothetical protein NT094_05805 [Candidatus Staskawiczbacteria bacterium]|nr:hypothetical protein [Candidatus Staskawiczbacteria bacterium]